MPQIYNLKSAKDQTDSHCPTIVFAFFALKQYTEITKIYFVSV